MCILVIFLIFNCANSESPKSSKTLSSRADVDYGGFVQGNSAYSDNYNSGSLNGNIKYNNNNNNPSSPVHQFSTIVKSASSYSGNIGSVDGFHGYSHQDRDAVAVAGPKEIEDSYIDSLVQLKINPKTSGYSGTSIIDHHYTQTNDESILNSIQNVPNTGGEYGATSAINGQSHYKKDTLIPSSQHQYGTISGLNGPESPLGYKSSQNSPNSDVIYGAISGLNGPNGPSSYNGGSIVEGQYGPISDPNSPLSYKSDQNEPNSDGLYGAISDLNGNNNDNNNPLVNYKSEVPIIYGHPIPEADAYFDLYKNMKKSQNKELYTGYDKGPYKEFKDHSKDTYHTNNNPHGHIDQNYKISSRNEGHGRDLKSDFKPSEPFIPTYDQTPPILKGFTPSYGPPLKSSDLDSINSIQDHPTSYHNSNNYYSSSNQSPKEYRDESNPSTVPTTPRARTSKEIRVHIQPHTYNDGRELIREESPSVKTTSEGPDYKVIFIKTPQETAKSQEIRLPSQNDQKPVVYLLSQTNQKSGHELDGHENVVNIVTPIPTQPPQPHLYFVQYQPNQPNLQNYETFSPNFYQTSANYPPGQLNSYEIQNLQNPQNSNFQSFPHFPNVHETGAGHLRTTPAYGDIRGYSRGLTKPQNTLNGLNNNLQYNQDLSQQFIYPTSTMPYYRNQNQVGSTLSYASLLNQLNQNAYTNNEPQPAYLNSQPSGGYHPHYPGPRPTPEQLVSPKINFQRASQASPLSAQLGSNPNSINHLTNIQDGFMKTYAPTFTPSSSNFGAENAENVSSVSSQPSNHYYMDGNTIADLLKAYGIESSSKQGDSSGSESETNSVSQHDEDNDKGSEKHARSTTLQASIIDVAAKISNNFLGVKNDSLTSTTSTVTSTSTTSRTESTTKRPLTKVTTKTTTKPTTIETKVPNKRLGESVQIKVPIVSKTGSKKGLKIVEVEEGRDEGREGTESSKGEINNEENSSTEIKVKGQGENRSKNSEESDEMFDSKSVELTSSEEAAVLQNSLENVEKSSESEGNNKSAKSLNKHSVPLYFESEKRLKSSSGDKLLKSTSSEEIRRKIRIQPSEARRLLKGHKRITKVKKPKNRGKHIKIINSQ